MAEYVFLIQHDAQDREFPVTWRFVSSGSTWDVDAADAGDNAFISASGHVAIRNRFLEFWGPNQQVYARLHVEDLDNIDIGTVGNISDMLTRVGFPSAGWRWLLQDRQLD